MDFFISMLFETSVIGYEQFLHCEIYNSSIKIKPEQGQWHFIRRISGISNLWYIEFLIPNV